MWRHATAFPPAFMAVLLAMGTALAEPSGDPAEADMFVTAEQAAIEALTLEPWMASEQELLEALRPIETNVLVQAGGYGTAEAAVEIADRDLADTVVARTDAELELAYFAGLLETLAINTFLLSDKDLDPSPDAQLVVTRRDAPLDVVTTDLIGEVRQSRRNLDVARDAEEAAEATVASVESALQEREQAVERANELVMAYEQMVLDRQTEIDARSEEAITLNEMPELALVEGFRVNVTLADDLATLLVAAKEDGILLGGWGHRAVALQIELRLSHCGDSGYAIFDMRAGECSPPTARPGRSEHELGLAIDFTENGAILNRSSPGFAWLQTHAAEYGLINLPSEAWHWSTTGH